MSTVTVDDTRCTRVRAAVRALREAEFAVREAVAAVDAWDVVVVFAGGAVGEDHVRVIERAMDAVSRVPDLGPDAVPSTRERDYVTPSGCSGNSVRRTNS